MKATIPSGGTPHRTPRGRRALPVLPAGLIALACAALAPVHAAAADTQEAHVHGVADINAVREEGAVHVELRMAAMDAVGFEHPPATDAERESVHRLKELLAKQDQLFAFPAAAECEGEIVDLFLEMEEDDMVVDEDLEPKDEDPADKAEGKEGEEHGKGHDHKDEAGAAKGAGDEAPAEGDDGHSDVTALYFYNCAKTDALDGLNAMVFEAFPSINLVRVQVVTAKDQAMVEWKRGGPQSLPLKE